MKDDELIIRYRNLLITVAREARNNKTTIDTMRAAIPLQSNPGKRAGMHTIIRSLQKQRALLLLLLGRNKAAAKHFFNTADPKKIAEETVTY